MTSPAPVRTYKAEEVSERLAYLREAFGKNKEIPPQYELAALTALSHYPELKEAKIKFVIRNSRAPIASWPVIGSLFNAKRNWCYRITISEDERWGDSLALVKNMTFNEAVGALGHELAHTVHYTEKNFFQMIAMGASFASRRFHKKFERDTDRRAIDYGLGWQLFDWAIAIRAGRYKTNKDSWLDRYYLSPQEIEEYINQTGKY